MKKEIAEKWVAKLRSGEIKQGTGFLRRSTGERCCLGVLCDMAVEAKRYPGAYNAWQDRGKPFHYGQATILVIGRNKILPEAVHGLGRDEHLSCGSLFI